MKTVTLKITGMHCTSCAMNIDFELEDLEGVKEVSTNYAKQVTTVTFDPNKIKLGKIIEVINNLEYWQSR
jgi:Cu+-exporting ATPase